jgi:hypothetical protein
VHPPLNALGGGDLILEEDLFASVQEANTALHGGPVEALEICPDLKERKAYASKYADVISLQTR